MSASGRFRKGRSDVHGSSVQVGAHFVRGRLRNRGVGQGALARSCAKRRKKAAKQAVARQLRKASLRNGRAAPLERGDAHGCR